MKIGPRHLQILPKWIPSLTTFGIAGGTVLCYATDWRAVLDYLPYYNGKFKPKE